jgi:hypothetical protein
MYGIVNKSLEELVTENFGEDKWEIIKQKSGINIDFFISSEPYNDDVTFKLAVAVSEEMGIPLSDVLFTFGEWWILRTTKEKYGNLLKSGGNNLKEFLVNLPQFHSHIMMLYPKLTPPEFKVSHIEERSIYIHYVSKRDGLKEFVRGLLSGLGKLYESPVEMTDIPEAELHQNKAIFKVTW